MDELLTSDEVMEELKISRSTLGRLLAAGQIKAQRIAENGALRFKRADVQAVLVPRGVSAGPTLGSRPNREQLMARGMGGYIKHG